MSKQPTSAEISRVMSALASRRKGEKRPGTGLASDPARLEKCHAGLRAWRERRRLEKAALAGHCQCGVALPVVKDTETPPEFCSAACKAAAQADEGRVA